MLFVSRWVSVCFLLTWRLNIILKTADLVRNRLKFVVAVCAFAQTAQQSSNGIERLQYCLCRTGFGSRKLSLHRGVQIVWQINGLLAWAANPFVVHACSQRIQLFLSFQVWCNAGQIRSSGFEPNPLRLTSVTAIKRRAFPVDKPPYFSLCDNRF